MTPKIERPPGKKRVSKEHRILNKEGRFVALGVNRAHAHRVVQRWNAEHPDDPHHVVTRTVTEFATPWVTEKTP